MERSQLLSIGWRQHQCPGPRRNICNVLGDDSALGGGPLGAVEYNIGTQNYRAPEYLHFCCSSGSTALGTIAQGKASEDNMHRIGGGRILHT